MKNQVVVHPFLFSLYPILLRYSVNYDFFEASVVFKPALLSALLAVGAWWATSAILSDRKRAAILVSAFSSLSTLLALFTSTSSAATREYRRAARWPSDFFS